MPMSRVAKQTDHQLIKKLSASFHKRTFITEFTKARHVSLTCASSTRSKHSYHFLKNHCHIVIPSTPRSPTKPLYDLYEIFIAIGRRQWPCGLRRGPAAARFQGFLVRIPPGARMSAFCERCVMSIRGICVELITPQNQSHGLWRVSLIVKTQQ